MLSSYFLVKWEKSLITTSVFLISTLNFVALQCFECTYEYASTSKASLACSTDNLDTNEVGVPCESTHGPGQYSCVVQSTIIYSTGMVTQSLFFLVLCTSSTEALTSYVMVWSIYCIFNLTNLPLLLSLVAFTFILKCFHLAKYKIH